MLNLTKKGLWLALLLWLTAQDHGYATPYWATFKQWRDLGHPVRQGEKATTIIFWQSRTPRDPDNTSDTGDATTTHRPFVARAYSVFNAAQTIGFYGFGNWAPSLIAAQGQGITKSLEYSFIIAFAYPAGPLLCSLFADRFERKHQIAAAAIGTATFGLLFARQSAPAALIALGVAITLSNNLLSFAYHAYQAELFPTRIRARAVGFVYSWSRLSTVFSSLIIAALLGAFGSAGVFAFIAGAMGVVVIAIGVFGPRTAGRSLEAVSR